MSDKNKQTKTGIQAGAKHDRIELSEPSSPKQKTPPETPPQKNPTSKRQDCSD